MPGKQTEQIEEGRSQVGTESPKSTENLNQQKNLPLSHQKNLTVQQKETPHQQNKASSSSSSRSNGRHNAHQELQRAATMAGGKLYTDHESLPSYESSLACFKEMYPRYSETAAMDTLRAEEYGHLEENGRVCLDYCGFGLFSHLQQVQQWESASFSLSNISVNLCSHALFGAAKDGTVECDIRKRIMGYLNIHEMDYSMVFTASRGASFKLLADAYPFDTCGRLITMYDYESESVGWMAQRAKEKGAKISNVSFKWPSLRIVSTKLRKLLVASRRQRRGPAKGLFVFPVQSRVSGAKYSYQWMSLAQQNKWHVLLDASAIGPKDMDSLGLSLFGPDFIIASFYKVFGGDPSGFGCLLIKNSAIQSIQDESGAPASGIVKIVPFPIQWSLSQSSEGDLDETNEFEEGEGNGQEGTDFEFYKGNELTSMVASFSGPMLGFNKHSPSSETSFKLSRIEGVMEEDDDDSSVCDSLGEVTRSPVFSEDGTHNLFCIDIGPSPVGTASRTSMSEDPFSGPFSGLIRNPIYDGGTNPSGTTQTLHNPLFKNSRNFENGANIVESKEDQGTKAKIDGMVEDDELSVSENGSEDLNVAALPSSKLKTSREKSREVELLDPGKSPFTVPGSASPVNHQGGLKHEHESVDESVSDSQGKVVRSRTDKVFPASVMEESSSDSLARSDRDVCEVDNVCVRNAESMDFQEENQGKEIKACETLNDMEKEKLESKQNSKGKAAWYQSESAIRRETEGEFRLLGRRNGDRLLVGRSLSPMLQDSEELDSAGGRGSFVGAEHVGNLYFGQSEMCSSSHESHEETRSDNDDGAEQEDEWDVREPEVVCRSLDHADMLGLNKTTLRLRYLINWLISALLQLRHPGPENNLSLVHLYGPQVKYDRGASVAFNLYDCHGKMLHPELVQMLADKNNISVSIGFLRNLQWADNKADIHAFLDNKRNVIASKSSHGRGGHRRGVPSRIEVVTAAMSVVSNFEDVYKLWVFVARFLDADFVSKELGGQQAPVGEVPN